MATTTIRLDDDFKTRVAAAAALAGKSPHAFMLDAIADSVEQAELDDEFHRIADERWAEYKRTGETVAWADAKAWLEAQARGVDLEWPAARKRDR